MNTKKVQIESNRRCSAEKLEKILEALPITVKGPGLQLNAYVGLGNIVYIRPAQGEVSNIKIGNIDMRCHKEQYSLNFTYKGRTFELKYT